jgi:hypothetical protein
MVSVEYHHDQVGKEFNCLSRFLLIDNLGLWEET